MRHIQRNVWFTCRKVWLTCTNLLVGRPEKTRIPPSFANPTKPRWDIINSFYCCHAEHMRKMRRFNRVGFCKLDPFCWCILSWQPPVPWCSGISACLNMGLDHRDQLGILWSWFWRVHQPSVARAEPWVIFLEIQNHPQINRYTKSGTIVRCADAYLGSFWCLLLYQTLLVQMWSSSEANTCVIKKKYIMSTWLPGARGALLERGKYFFLPHKAGLGPRAPLEDSLSFDTNINI